MSSPCLQKAHSFIKSKYNLKYNKHILLLQKSFPGEAFNLFVNPQIPSVTDLLEHKMEAPTGKDHMSLS